MRVPGHEGTKCWYAAQTVAEADAPSARARSLAVESRAEPEVQTPSPQPTTRLDIKPTESGIEAQTLPESGNSQRAGVILPVMRQFGCAAEPPGSVAVLDLESTWS